MPTRTRRPHRTSCKSAFGSSEPNLPQSLPGHEQSRPHGPCRNIKDVGRFRIRLAFDFSQPQQRSLVLRQALQRVCDQRFPFRIGACLSVVFQGTPGFASPPTFSCPVPSYAKEVRSNALVRGIKAVRVTPKMCKDFWCQVFCDLRRRNDLTQECTQPRRILAIDRSERACVPAPLLRARSPKDQCLSPP